MKIFLQSLCDHRVEVDVEPTDYVRNIIEKLNIHCEARILFGGRQLNDDLSLADCGIQDGDTLHYILRLRAGAQPMFFLHVMLPSGGCYTHEFGMGTTVGYVKELIEGETGIKTALQELSIKDEVMTDGKTLGEYDITKETTIRLKELTSYSFCSIM